MSMRRIQKFLKLEELDDDTTNYGSSIEGAVKAFIQSQSSGCLPCLLSIKMNPAMFPGVF